MPLLNNNSWNCPLNDAQIALMSSGQGLFETLLYERQTLWFWERHQNRFFHSLRKFGIENGQISLGPFIIRQLNKSPLKGTLRVKLICLFPFDNPPARISESDLILLVEPVTSAVRHPEPLALKTIAAPLSAQNELTGHKTLAYTYFNYGRRLARQAGFDEAIFVNRDRELQETSYSNIFAIRGEEVCTPPLSAGILPGTVRGLLVEHCAVQEKVIRLSDIKTYDFFFLSSSLRELHAVRSIDGYQSHIPAPDVFNRLNTRWQEIRNAYHQQKLE